MAMAVLVAHQTRKGPEKSTLAEPRLDRERIDDSVHGRQRS
jgi:hypothetical protein